MFEDFINCKTEINVNGTSANLTLKLANGDELKYENIALGNDLTVRDFWYGFKYKKSEYDLNIWLNEELNTYLASVYEVKDGQTTDSFIRISVDVNEISESSELNDNEVICEIKWTVADVRKSFVDKYGRQPTEGELSDCVQNVDCKALEDRSTEYGWSFIEEAIV